MSGFDTPDDPGTGRLPTPDDADRAGAAPPRGAARPGPPRTGDIVADAALADLAAADPVDLDAQLTTGEQVERTLRGRLADLGG